MLKQVYEFAAALSRVIRIRFDKSNLEEIPQLVEFVSTRSAYVAQTSLFGYLKTRMGREYVSIFKDDVFLPSIETAKWSVYAACLSDLTIYAVSLAAKQYGLQRDKAESLAMHLHQACVDSTFEGKTAESIRQQSVDEFRDRSSATIWANAAIGESAFSLSPAALADASPVSDEFKELDREIVMNSIRLRWNDVRSQLRKRLDGPAICSAWLNGGQSGKVVDVPAAGVRSRRPN